METFIIKKNFKEKYINIRAYCFYTDGDIKESQMISSSINVQKNLTKDITQEFTFEVLILEMLIKELLKFNPRVQSEKLK